MALQATIETTNAELINLLQPMIEVVQNFDGHLNYFYSRRHYNDGINYCHLDVLYKQALMGFLKPLLPDNFLMGCGGGHVWIAYSTRRCDDKYSANFQQPVADLHDRILLITDKD